MHAKAENGGPETDGLIRISAAREVYVRAALFSRGPRDTPYAGFSGGGRVLRPQGARSLAIEEPHEPARRAIARRRRAVSFRTWFFAGRQAATRRELRQPMGRSGIAPFAGWRWPD